MSSLEEKAAVMSAQLAARSGTTQGVEKAASPADAKSNSGKFADRKRIPMTLPQQKLAVPELPGYFTYWMLGKPERLQAADNAGYEFVHEDEIDVNNISLGGDAAKSGNTDMGSRVSVLASATGDGESSGGQPLRLYLMKQKLEWHLEDQGILERQNEGIANALTASFGQGTVGGKAEGETSVDFQQRYVDPRRSRVPDFFKPKRKR